jgi:hypothetical protein
MDERLTYLLSGLVEETLSELEMDELSQLLENSAEVRADYMLFMATHVELNRQTSADMDHGAVLQFPGDAPPSSNGRWTLLAMAAAAILALVGALVWGPGNDPANIDQTPIVEGPKPIESGVIVVGRLTESSDGTLVAAVDERRVMRAEGIRPGGYHLFDGLVELTLKNGIELTLEGPAEFSFDSSAKMALLKGKMAAYVPPTGQGFTVDLPDATVVDLGTKFGIEVQENGTSEVHVFKGLVEVTPKNGDAAYLLRGKQASRFGLEARKHDRIELDPNRFVRQLREPESEYSRLVLSYRPVIYLPMVPSRDGETLYDMSGNELHGKARRITDYKHLWAHGRIGSGLRFDGTTFRGYAAVWNYPRTDGNKITGMAWVKADSYNEWASIMKNWSGNLHGQFHFGLYETTGQLEVHVSDDGQEVFAIEDKPLPLNEWHHVAFVADGNTLRLYRNGEEVAASAYKTLLNREDVRHLVIGNKADPKYEKRENPIQLWHGRLDEIALFYHALDAESIREVYQAGMRWDYEEETQIGGADLNDK